MIKYLQIIYICNFNKQSLLRTNMDELDKKKKITLEKCYLKVNKDFGNIFGDLLPGA